MSTVLLAPSYKTIFETYVKCSLHPSHSDFLLEHFFVSVFNMDFPSMIRLNNIIIAAGFVVSGNCRACGECLICLTLLMTLSQKSDVPLDWQRSQFHLYCQTRTGTKTWGKLTGARSNQQMLLPLPRHHPRTASMS